MLNSSSAKWLGLLAGAAMTLLAFIGSVMLGTTPLEWSALWRMLTAYDPANVAHIILYTERLPRAVVPALVGASLAVAGALMRAMTRNPLASPGILGINAGALFFVVVAVGATAAAYACPLCGCRPTRRASGSKFSGVAKSRALWRELAAAGGAGRGRGDRDVCLLQPGAPGGRPAEL